MTPSRTRLTLTGLPAHTSVDVNFLLAIIDSWDGTGPNTFQPDYFNVAVDGVSVFSETFTNVGGSSQSYQPTAAGVRLTTGVFDHGFSLFPNVGDSAYNMGLEPRLHNIAHTASTLTIEWFASGAGWEGGTNESWAIDNVQVVLNGVTPAPTRAVEDPPDAWRPTTGLTVVGSNLVGVQTVPFIGPGDVAQKVNFGNLRVLDVTGGYLTTTGSRSPVGLAGSSVILTAVVTDLNPANGSNFSYAWQVLNPSGQVLATATTSTIGFITPDEGTYTAGVTLTDLDDGNRQYRDRFLVFAKNATTIGLDPLVNIPTTLSATAGSTVTAPVNIDNADGLDLVDLQIGYDPAVMDVLGVRTGTVTSGAMLVTNPTDPANASGTIAVGLVLPTPHGPGGGSLLEVDYRIKPSAPAGPVLLDLRQVSLNEGVYVLTPTPIPGPDPTDGLITIVAAPGNATPVPGTQADDSTLAQVTPTVTRMNELSPTADAARSGIETTAPLLSRMIDSSDGTDGDNFEIRNSKFEMGLAGRDAFDGGLGQPPSEGTAPLLIDWSGSFNPSGTRGANASASPIFQSAHPWVRPFLLELATDKATNPNRDIRIELPDAAELLPEVNV